MFTLLAGPLAWPRTPGACWRGLRLVAVDGTGIAIPDSDTNRAWTDKTRTASHPCTGYPLLRLVTLVECGTRALIAAVDRNFDAAPFITHTACTGADLLIRLKANRRPPLTGRHTDGSIRSVIGGIEVRIIEALIT